MKWNIVGAFVRNNPFGTEIAFRKGLERIGETVNVYDPSVLYKAFPLDPDADVTLIFKWLDPGIIRDTIATYPGKKIVYQVDDLRFPHIKVMMQEMRQVCDHALTFDDDGAKLAREYGYGSAQRLLLTADDQLYKPISGIRKDIDISFIGSLTGGENHRSRHRMCQIVEQYARTHGLKFMAGELYNIPQINEIYNRSKVVLNHATDVGQPFGHGFGYQCRHFEAGFSGACVLSNTVDNDNTIKAMHFFSDEKSLINKLSELLYDPEDLIEFSGLGLLDEMRFCHTPQMRAQELKEFVRSIK